MHIICLGNEVSVPMSDKSNPRRAATLWGVLFSFSGRKLFGEMGLEDQVQLCYKRALTLLKK